MGSCQLIVTVNFLNMIDFDKNNKIIENINKLKLIGLKDFKCGYALVVPLFNHKKIPVKKLIASSIAVMLKTRFDFEVTESGETALFFSPHYCGRKDYQNDFNNVSNLFSNKCLIKANSKKRFSLSRFAAIFYYINWLFKLRSLIKDINLRLECCNFLLSGFLTYKFLKKFFKKRNKPNLSIVFCDFFASDCIAQQYFKSVGSITATLQHASYYHRSHAYQYYFSISDYFLGINEYSKIEAQISGYDIKRFFVCGPMKFLGCLQNNTPCVADKIKKIGICLSGKSFEEDNIKLLHLINSTPSMKKYHIVFKPHPTIRFDDYKCLLRELEYEVAFGSMNDFILMCDCFIMGSTNAFADIVGANKLAFRFVYNDESDIFYSLDKLLFRDSKTLERIMGHLERDPHYFDMDLKYSKNFLMPSGSIDDNYLCAINKIREVNNK